MPHRPSLEFNSVLCTFPTNSTLYLHKVESAIELKSFPPQSLLTFNFLASIKKSKSLLHILLYIFFSFIHILIHLNIKINNKKKTHIPKFCSYSAD